MDRRAFLRSAGVVAAGMTALRGPAPSFRYTTSVRRSKPGQSQASLIEELETTFDLARKYHIRLLGEASAWQQVVAARELGRRPPGTRSLFPWSCDPGFDRIPSFRRHPPPLHLQKQHIVK